MVASDYWRTLLDEDGRVRLWSGFVPAAEAGKITAELIDSLAWQRESISMFGRQVTVPRLVCWYGDTGTVYRYSGVTHDPLPWTPLLSDLRERVEQAAGCEFNSVLANLYRDGNDSMGWHADKEAELGVAPVIASLSFGATRLFRLQHRKTKRAVSVPLENGDLLLMEPPLQACWRHCVPKAPRIDSSRVNLTFRRIV